MDALKELRAVNQTEFDDLQLYFLISCIVFGAIIAILAGAVIGLYVWVFKINKSQNKNAQFSRSRGRTLQPNEELAKRYVMSAEDERRLNGESMLEPFPFNKQQSVKQPDILKNDNSRINTNVPSSTKHLDKRSEPRDSPGIKRFGDNFVDELYY